MRVAAVFRAPHPTQGGEHTFGESILEALRAAAPRSTHEFVYYVAGPRDPRADVHISTNWFYSLRRSAAYQARDLCDQLGLPQVPRTWLERSFAKKRVDLAWFATSYVERCDLPYIFTIMDIEHTRLPWFPEVSARGIWERRERYFSRSVRRATRVIVPNTAGLDHVTRHYRVEPERILCLRHPTPEWARGAGQRDPLPRERVDRLGISGRYVLYPAQFWPHKNHTTLVDAVALLNRDGSPYHLALVGSDKSGQLAYVREYAQRSGLADFVHFLGFTSQEDLIALYQHAHALTYMSYFGPENLPPLEAFALGCPVIAVDVPGVREQLGDAAKLVSVTDAHEVADAVRELEDQSMRASLIERGRDRATPLSSEQYISGVLDFLDEFELTRRCWP